MIRWIYEEFRDGDWWDRLILSFLLSSFVALSLILSMPVISYFEHYNHAGHYNMVHVEGGYESQTIVMSNGTVGFTTTYVPEHDEKRWTCDTCRNGK